MELRKLRCPECGANFEGDERVSFCSYCGVKLYFDDGTQNINHNYSYKKEDVAKIKEVEVDREIKLKKMQEETRSQKWTGIVFLIIGIIFAIFFVSYFSGQKNDSDMEEKQLQSLVNEICVDINNGNYETALVKTKSLHYTSGWASEIEEKWDDTREALLEIIEEKMK